MYTLADLHLFLRAADCSNLSAAARQLGMTPAAASATLKRLEQQLQVRLFERSTRSLRLTAEGAVFRDSCEKALGMLADGEALMHQGKRALAGDVHLAAPADLARAKLRPWLDEFQERHPAIRLVLHVSDSLHDLLRDTVDLALRYGEVQDQRLIARRLHDGRRIACAAPAYLERRGRPHSPQDLAGHNCLCFFISGRPDRLWTFERGEETVSVQVDGDRSCDDSSLARQWALEGRGIVCKARIDLEADLDAGRLVPLFDGWTGEASPLHAVYLGGKYMPLRVRALLDFLLARFGEAR